MLEALSKFDKWLFLKINNGFTNELFDAVMPVYRDQNMWIPLYLFLLLFVLMNFGMKAWPWVLFVALTATITDQVSSSFLKDFVNRTRPCNDENVYPYMRLLLSRCPQSGSFTSSHAANHFGAAMFFYLTLKPYLRKYVYLFFIWAASICYAQVYIGVHYPFDVIGGAALGVIIGSLTGWFYRKWLGLPSLEDLPEIEGT